jgi:signal transduction histidine kinase
VVIAMADTFGMERGDLTRLAEEQAALRRVATLVAGGAPAEEVFAAVTEEVGRQLSADFVGMGRYESDGAVAFLAVWRRGGTEVTVGPRWPLGGKNVSTIVSRTGRSARIDSESDLSGPIPAGAGDEGIRSSVGAPIIVEDRPWGLMYAASTLGRPLPADTETRLADFTELVATAIANAESRAGLARLVEEQAALRRVATLVARGAPPEDVVAAVVEEVGQLLPVDLVGMGRYDPDGSQTIVASWGLAVERFPVGSRLPLGGQNLATIVLDTGRPARRDDYADASGTVGATARESGFRSAVGTPIIVEGRVWGVVIAGSSQEQPLPADTEARLARFTELLATAIANAESRAELNASRARIVIASDDARRRIERDLHGGTAQRLVSLSQELRAAQAALPPGLGELDRELNRVAEGLASVQEGLREIARGIHPAILAEGGLGPALQTLARRCPIPTELDVRVKARLPDRVEVAAYFVVSEALTNAAKHSHASVTDVEVQVADRVLRLSIRDDGAGGADPTRGSGLIGLKDRVETLGGTITVRSPLGAGTSVHVEFPLED